jgi:hypothetical protein
MVSRCRLKITLSVCPQLGNVLEFASVMSFLQRDEGRREPSNVSQFASRDATCDRERA